MKKNIFKILLFSSLIIVFTACGSDRAGSSKNNDVVAGVVEIIDSDGDGINDRYDEDDDNDGLPDDIDPNPTNPG